MTKRGMRKSSLAFWIGANVIFAVLFAFPVGIVSGVLVLAIGAGGALVPVKRFPLPPKK